MPLRSHEQGMGIWATTVLARVMMFWLHGEAFVGAIRATHWLPYERLLCQQS